MARTENIPAHAGVAKAGVTYDVSPDAKAALDAFVADVPKIAPANYELQGYRLNRAVFHADGAAARPGRRRRDEHATTR